jgi:signal transduction histidine kinase
VISSLAQGGPRTRRASSMVWNVVSDAIKFTPKRGHVRMALQRVESHVGHIVKDAGHGLSAYKNQSFGNIIAERARSYLWQERRRFLRTG